MAEIVKITKGQPFVFYVPLVILNADGSKEAVEAASITDVAVMLQGVCDTTEATYDTIDRFLVVRIPATLATGEYAVVITATLASGRAFALRIKRAFAVVDWDQQSNWRDYLVGEHIELCDQPFIAGEFTTDAEYEALKQQLREQIAAAEQAEAEAIAEKERYAEALEHLDDVAKESTLLQKSAAIIEAISGIHIDIPENIATKDDVTAAKQAILDALSHISPEDPNSKALAEFFGVTLLQGYEFMQDTEVTDELEEIMQVLDPELLQEVEYPEGSGTYMTKAQLITIQAMQIINDDEEQS